MAAAAAFEAPRTMNIVKQRRAELEVVQPFREARDLMLASLSDPKDRDRSRLTSLVEDETPSIARARTCSDQLVEAELGLPAKVFQDFIAACESCERVLEAHASGEQQQKAQWLVQMKRAAEAYLGKVRAQQKEEEAAMRKALGLEPLEEIMNGGEAEDEGQSEDAESTADPGSSLADEGAPLEELLPWDEDSNSEVGLQQLEDFLGESLGIQQLEDFLGESAPAFVEAFGHLKPGAAKPQKKQWFQQLQQAVQVVRKNQAVRGRRSSNRKQAGKSVK